MIDAGALLPSVRPAAVVDVPPVELFEFVVCSDANSVLVCSAVAGRGRDSVVSFISVWTIVLVGVVDSG